jgi:DNA polymerase-3 subunit gamma/tau
MSEDLNSKYRPALFSEVVGQPNAVSTLTGFVRNGPPPTLLICGPHAVGKTTLARILARRLNCLKSKGPEPCGKCESCRDENHADIREVNAADDRGIGTIRKLQEVGRLAPSYKRMVIIMDECHALTPQAYQAALKLFEEPAASTTFILVTTNPEKLPKTITSRCSIVRLKLIRDVHMAKWLFGIAKKEKFKLDKKGAERLAEASAGHPREALTMLQQLLSGDLKANDLDSLIQQVTEMSPRALTAKFVDAIMNEDMKGALQVAAESEDSEHFLSGATEAFQALLLYKIDKSMVEGIYRSQFAKIKVDVRDVADVLRVFGAAYQKAKTYLLPADTALALAIVDAIPERN